MSENLVKDEQVAVQVDEIHLEKTMSSLTIFEVAEQAHAALPSSVCIRNRKFYDVGTSTTEDQIEEADEKEQKDFDAEYDDFNKLHFKEPIEATESKQKDEKSQNPTTTKEKFFRKCKRFYEHHQFELDTAFTVFLFLFDIYKILVGSFLTVFTYQSCDILEEKFGCFDAPFSLVALSWNLITFVCCFVLLGFQVHRESYFIRELFHFEESSKSIQEYFEKYAHTTSTLDINNKDILKQVEWFNSQYCLMVKVCIGCFLINFVLSSVSLFVYMYMGTKTITSFLSNMFLLGLLIAKGFQVVSLTENDEHTIACSAYTQKYIKFNGVNIWTRWRSKY